MPPPQKNSLTCRFFSNQFAVLKWCHSVIFECLEKWNSSICQPSETRFDLSQVNISLAISLLLSFHQRRLQMAILYHNHCGLMCGCMSFIFCEVRSRHHYTLQPGQSELGSTIRKLHAGNSCALMQWVSITRWGSAEGNSDQFDHLKCTARFPWLYLQCVRDGLCGRLVWV